MTLYIRLKYNGHDQISMVKIALRHSFVPNTIYYQ